MRRFIRGFAAIAMGCVLLVGCGASGSSDYASDSGSYKEGAAGNGFDNYDYYDSEEVTEEDYEEEAAQSEGSEGSASGSTGSTKDSTTNKINNDKLIYTCSLTIETLDYASSVKSFRELISKYDGFVERESESDDGDMGDYYADSRSDKHYTYTATVRIPSKDYDSFLNETGSIGDIRSRDAHVENISQSYYNLSAELEVLETKYSRYLEMLKKATTTKDILEIENSITSLETQINQIKTQLNRYDNDVAYSYINITISQVKVLEEDKPDKTTVPGAFKASWDNFTDAMYALLIVFIYMLPHLIVLGVIAVIVLIIVRLAIKRSRRKKSESQIGDKAKSNTGGNTDDSI